MDNEFKEELPFDLSDNLFNATTPRRDFLKFLGFSTLAATLVASCEMPVRKAIPYAIKPEDIVPGVPNYYASTFVDGGEYCPIIIKTRDGRPIKIEGNDLSSITKGGTTARIQASVLNLYDKARIRHPYADGGESTFAAIDGMIKDGIGTKPGYLVTSSILSPTIKEIIAQFIAKYPSVKHIVYDVMSASGALQANEACYGKRTLPTYRFDKAQTIFGLGADFLGTWLSPVEFSKGYAHGRKISAKNLNISKHYQVEAIQTITGGMADHRATCRPSEKAAVALALYKAITDGTQPNLSSPALNKLVVSAAADLKKGNGLVVCGCNDAMLQTVINAINDKIGATGTTIDWNLTCNYRQGIDKDMADFVTAMATGEVGSVFLYGVNPVYDYHDGKTFAAALAKVPVTVSFADRLDETAQKCKYVIPDHNYLESWGDAEPKPGYFSLMQPGIAPLFKTRSFAQSLLVWTGSTQTYQDYWQQYWLKKLGSQEKFDKALQDGVIEPGSDLAMAPTAAEAGKAGDKKAVAVPVAKTENHTEEKPAPAGLAAAIADIESRKPGTGVEIAIYQTVGIGYGGAYSNNPWLLEMPDPITRATWDNYLCVSPKRAKELDSELTGFSEVDAKKRVVKIKSNTTGYEVKLPIVVMPGMHNDVVAIAVGFGRDAKVGRAAASDDTKGGKNAYPFKVHNGNTVVSHNEVTITKTDEKYEVAITQTHNSYEARPIIHEYTLDTFTKDPQVLLKERGEQIAEFAHEPLEEGKEAKIVDSTTEEGYREHGTLYPNYKYEGVKWGMSIDLNTCTGCAACVIGCQAENNVSVVGKNHVLLNHEMHWIRIDRYFSGMADNPDSIQTIFQPMLCQHCDNAPCENVCPVSATNHSSEGLNQMAYNRCIGTKYCANNCPYKVRRFNWMDWNGADCFEGNLYEDDRRDDINDDLTRMVLNPDVTVRSRGVMEKCSFCVQRLQDGKLAAKKAGRPVKDGEVRTACQQACPTDAITFGNVKDKESKIAMLRKDEQMERTFYVLEHIHTLPNVNYLAKIRNTDEIDALDEEKNYFLKYHI
jgi:molybdopterin-containing oxidoreductase family iron-sulfur binding subunit